MYSAVNRGDRNVSVTVVDIPPENDDYSGKRQISVLINPQLKTLLLRSSYATEFGNCFTDGFTLPFSSAFYETVYQVFGGCVTFPR